ncbi:hypothetical protein J0910_30135 [Nocardiopsis sp. CNT-189]|uniref:hypothetical protein n=1 Tax=Nocardiopsis oceanisediminis TaxID=2816862 RepID=UPI003B314391
MFSIENLIRERSFSPPSRPLEMDPLRENNALQEAQLLDSRVCPLTSVAALLFEMRTALQFKDGNAALLVVRNLHSFNWTSSSMETPFVALTAVSSIPECEDNLFHMRLGFYLEAQLASAGNLTEFYLLDVEEISEAPPDYLDADQDGIYRELPSWSSVCNLLQISSLN